MTSIYVPTVNPYNNDGELCIWGPNLIGNLHYDTPPLELITPEMLPTLQRVQQAYYYRGEPILERYRFSPTKPNIDKWNKAVEQVPLNIREIVNSLMPAGYCRVNIHILWNLYRAVSKGCALPQREYLHYRFADKHFTAAAEQNCRPDQLLVNFDVVATKRYINLRKKHLPVNQHSLSWELSIKPEVLMLLEKFPRTAKYCMLRQIELGFLGGDPSAITKPYCLYSENAPKPMVPGTYKKTLSSCKAMARKLLTVVNLSEKEQTYCKQIIEEIDKLCGYDKVRGALNKLKELTEANKQFFPEKPVELFPDHGLELTYECKEIKLVRLMDKSALAKEGKTMHHCVGGYTTQCKGNLAVFSVEQHGKHIATLSLYKYYGNWTLNQLSGQCNTYIRDEQVTKPVQSIIDTINKKKK